MTATTTRKPVQSRAIAKGRTSAKARTGAVNPLPSASKILRPIVKTAAVAAPQIKRTVKKNDAATPAKTKVKAVAKVVTPKTKKPKLVRDSFTIPKNEYLALQQLKDRALGLVKIAKKGELLRAGLLALAHMSDAAFLAALAAVPALKTGRPKGAKTSKK